MEALQANFTSCCTHFGVQVLSGPLPIAALRLLWGSYIESLWGVGRFGFCQIVINKFLPT